MPDASGRIRGISVPRVPWHEPPADPKDRERYWADYHRAAAERAARLAALERKRDSRP